MAMREGEQVGERVEGDLLLLAGAAQLHLDGAVGQPALAHHQLQRPADEVGVGELHAGALVAVVDGHLEAQVGQLASHALGLGLHGVVAHGQRDDAHMGRRNRERPHDAMLVVVLLDHGGQGARDAYAIAAHDEGHLVAFLVGEGGPNGDADPSCIHPWLPKRSLSSPGRNMAS